MADSEKIHQVVNKAFEEHHIENTSLQNALIDIFESFFLSDKQNDVSSNVLSEKLRDKPENN